MQTPGLHARGGGGGGAGAHICACTSLCSYTSVYVHKGQCGHTGIPANPLSDMPLPAEGPGSAGKDQQGGQQTAIGAGGAGGGYGASGKE